jgi:D-serine deaminase-like pyridoxal phosphate-dependent protein
MPADPYFSAMSAALRDAGVFQPSLVLDLDRLNGNIERVRSRLSPKLALRLVDKSLACLPLLGHIRAALATDRFMTFHLPVSLAVLEAFPTADLLLGKPMPSGAARTALTGPLSIPQARSRLCWLIDSEQRLAQYGALASELDVDLRICFEVDAGLHRGGFSDPAALSRALALLDGHKRLHCEGIMAYEAHIPHIPALFGGPGQARATAKRLLRQFAKRLAQHQRGIINLGGSKTAMLYGDDTAANEVSAGSAFVLPTDFDVPGLAGFQPAAFIATPVLKVVEPRLPGSDWMTAVMQRLGLFPQKGCYLYGGRWMAEPVYPAGMKANRMLGLSSNQQFMGLPAQTDIAADEYAFMRPTQSEFVLQQFGSINVYRAGRIVDRWQALPMS